MRTAKHLPSALGALAAAALIAVACREAMTPERSLVGILEEEEHHPPPQPPPEHDDDHEDVEHCPAEFRLTGGGRTDERDHTGFDKNTPDERDFATFGFQARPTGACPPDNSGSGQFQWVEHNPNEPLGGGFAFHGRVDSFSAVETDQGEPLSGVCGRFGGLGRLNPRNGATENDVEFEVTHACDDGEPGRGVDHIRLRIGPAEAPRYVRHGLLSGGNIQWHRLTGNAAN